MDHEHTTGWGPLSLVVGIDIEHPEEAAQALGLAADLRSRGLTHAITVCHVRTHRALPLVKKRRLGATLEAARSLTQRALGALEQVTIVVRSGDVARELSKLGDEVGADMIVIGPRRASLLHGRGVARRLLGASSAAVLVAKSARAASAKEADVPEPPCPDCMEARRASDGSVLWCAMHARPRVETHVYDSSVDEVRWTAPNVLYAQR